MTDYNSDQNTNNENDFLEGEKGISKTPNSDTFGQKGGTASIDKSDEADMYDTEGDAFIDYRDSDISADEI